MARLGTRTPGGPTYDLHRGDLVVDEAAIAIGARTLAGVVFSAASGRGVETDRPRRLGLAR
jgi:amidohydrolase